MNDNVIAYILSLVCIIFILIEIVFVNKKKGMADLIVFFYYSCPLYYFMLYRGDGGAAFTWWFYLLLLTFIHLVILAFRIIKYIISWINYLKYFVFMGCFAYVIVVKIA